MSLFVPDGVKLYEPDLDTIVQFLLGNSVLDGLAITAQATPNMTVAISAGARRYGGALGAVTAVASRAIAAADPTNPRIDLVHVDDVDDTLTVVTGTPAAVPKPPALPAGKLLLGYVSVAAAAVNIQQSNITDRRILGAYGLVAGTLANRPTATAANTAHPYFATDSVGGTLFRSNGSSWVAVAPGVTHTHGAGLIGGQSAKATITGDITTTSTTLVDATGLSVTIVTTGGDVLVFFSANVRIDAAAALVVTLLEDGVEVAGTNGLAWTNMASASNDMPLSFVWRIAAPAAASHTYKIQWRVGSSTGTMRGNPRTSLVVMELPH